MTGVSAIAASRVHGLLDRCLRPVEDAAAIIGGSMMLVAMILSSLDALMRYALNAPLTFQYHLTENYLMVGLVAMPLAWGFRTGGYIRIEGLIHALPGRASDWVLRAGLLVSSIYIAVLAWTAGKHFLDVYRSGEVHFGVIDWPVSWSWIWVPVGCGLLALRLLLMAFGPAGELAGKHDAAEEGV